MLCVSQPQHAQHTLLAKGLFQVVSCQVRRMKLDHPAEPAVHEHGKAVHAVSHTHTIGGALAAHCRLQKEMGERAARDCSLISSKCNLGKKMKQKS